MGSTGPVIAQIAVVKIIGEAGCDVRGDTGGQIPGHLWTIRRCGRHTELISGKEAASILLATPKVANASFAVESNDSPM